MRQDSPLKPGVPVMSSNLQGRLLKLLPLICVIMAFAIVSMQYARRERIKNELAKAKNLYTELKARDKKLRDIIRAEKGPGAAPEQQNTGHDDHHDHND